MNIRNSNRSIPANTPLYIRLKVYRSEFKGREQWKGRYRFYHNDKQSDYIDVVVNPFYDRPFNGEEWWVELKGMAPVARIVFADIYERVREDNRKAPRGGEGAYYFRTHDERGKYIGESRRPRPAPRRSQLREMMDWDSAYQILLDEERYNGEPPDCDYY
jgi:hypothetical protein